MSLVSKLQAHNHSLVFILAKKYLDSVYSHIEDKLSEGFKSVDQGLEKVDELKQSMGTCLKDIFKANDNESSTTGVEVNGKIIEEIGDEIVVNESWLESIREKLRSLEKVLGKQLKKIKNACEESDDFKTWATLSVGLTNDFEDGAPIVAAITLAAVKALKWPLKKLIGTAKITLGAVAQQFWYNNVSEAAQDEEDLGIEEDVGEKEVEKSEKIEHVENIGKTSEKTVEKEPETVRTETEKTVKNDVDGHQVEIEPEKIINEN